MPLTVRQDSRRNTATALSAMFFTSHAQVSSSTYVHFAPGRAHGTCATSTPCSGHRTRGAAACRNVRVVPVSTVRHRLVPAPESYPGHGRRHCPHRPADLASGRTDTTRTSSSPSGSTWTVTSSMTMPWTPNSCPNTLALRMPCPSPSFRSLSKTKTTAGRGMSLQNRRSATHYNVTRAIAARAHPIPQPVKVVLQIQLELADRLLIDSRRAFVRRDLPTRLPHQLFGNIKRFRLCSAHRLLPPDGG